MFRSNVSGRGLSAAILARTKGALLTAACIQLISALGPAFGATPVEDLQRYVQQSLAEWQTPGASLALVKDGKVILARGFGVRSVGGRAAVDENTLFGIGSCSKAFGSASVAALVADGTVAWDDRLRKHLPDLQLWDPWVTERITVRDMLSHRTGTSLDVEANGMPTIQRPQDWVTRLQYTTPAAGFREKYVYSNAMYVASALMVERLTGRDWNDFAAERLWRPLHMDRTNGSFERTVADPNHSDPHFLINGHVITSDAQIVAPGTIPATGNVESTAHDMGRWLLFHLGEGTVEGEVILPAKVVHEMHSPQIPIRGGAQEAAYYFERIDSQTLKTRDWSYGMGWFLNDFRDKPMVWHGGTIPGFRCMVGFMPEQRVGVYVAANRTSLLPVALFLRSMDALIGAPPTDWSKIFQEETRYQEAQDVLQKNRRAATRVAGTQPSIPLDRFQGTFSSDPLGDLTVAFENGVLRVVWGLRRGRLVHWHYDTFQIVWDRPEFDDTPLATFQVGAAADVPSVNVADVGVFKRIRAATRQ
jgi:CubicO group peptidase (beta-lactamase class C family)